jgi:hypothetical protein
MNPMRIGKGSVVKEEVGRPKSMRRQQPFHHLVNKGSTIKRKIIEKLASPAKDLGANSSSIPECIHEAPWSKSKLSTESSPRNATLNIQ